MHALTASRLLRDSHQWMLKTANSKSQGKGEKGHGASTTDNNVTNTSLRAHRHPLSPGLFI